MNAPRWNDSFAGTFNLAWLASPGCLARPARLYGVVLDERGCAGARHFLANVPQGAAVFAVTAPGVSFLLRDRGPPVATPLVTAAVPDAVAIEAWYGALLSAPGLPRGSDGRALPVARGERRSLSAGTRLTARHVVWLQADSPILAYPAADGVEASLATTRLVLADQICAEVTGDGGVGAVDTAAFAARHPAAVLAEHSAQIALRIGAALIESDTAKRERWQQVQAIDRGRASQSLQRLRDIAYFARSLPRTESRLDQGALTGVLSILGTVEGFELRVPQEDDARAPLAERLEAFSIASGFRFREIALDGRWWREEGPPFIAVDAETGTPMAVMSRRRRRYLVDPRTGAERAVDPAVAARLEPRGYMLYPSLPDKPTGRDIWRFSTFGIGGDIGRLFATSVAASFAGLLMPVAVGALLGVAIPDGNLALLRDMLVLLVAAALGSTGFQLARSMSLIRLFPVLDRRLEVAVWDRVVRLPNSFLRRYPIGDLADRIDGVYSILSILCRQTVGAIVGGVFSLASLAIMLIYDASLTAFAAGYAIVAGSLLFLAGRAQRRRQQQSYDQKGVVSGLLIELIGGIAKLRIAAAELRAFSRWSDAFAKQRASSAAGLRMAAVQAITVASLPFAGAVGIFGIAAGGDQPVDVASFAAFYSAFGQFTAAILAMAGALTNSIDVLPIYARLRPLLEAPLEVEQHRIDPGKLDGRIAIRNLWFRYAETGPWVLENVDFDIRAGESLAIVGASGSGKSTVLRLLLGLETPARGGIHYDDRDLAELDLRLVRRQIGTVLETSSLLPGTLHENIAGNSLLSRERVAEAVRLAGLEADIAAMPHGLDTEITEGGSLISGGQRQRVMIARALVKRPRLLFFDQATSALDNHTQAIVEQSVLKMNATRIVVAHRLSTIRHVDRILVLENGRVAESGTYDELIAKGGAFQRLVQRQIL